MSNKSNDKIYRITHKITQYFFFEYTGSSKADAENKFFIDYLNENIDYTCGIEVVDNKVEYVGKYCPKCENVSDTAQIELANPNISTEISMKKSADD